MLFRLAAVVVALTIPSVSFAADDENPYKSVKVGDYAKYKMTAGPAGNVEMTQKVIEKSDKEAVVEVSISFNGKNLPGQKQTIDLTKPFDALKSGIQPGTDAKIEKGKSGTEKVKVGDKEYDCTWQEMKVTITVAKMEIVSESKVWTSKSAPLAGLVKVESKALGMETKMELVESGSKK